MNIYEKSKVYFSLVKDYREKSYITYKLDEILFLVMCGMICGCKDIEEMVEVLEHKLEIIQKYIDIERIPCKTTFTTILSLINPDEMDLCMIGILKNVVNIKITYNVEKREISIDGKAIRSTNNNTNAEKALQIVTALDIHNSIVVAQVKINDKTNEITAGRDLIELLNLKNTIVTADAIHTQKETAEKIIEKGGDYILQVKLNQKTLYENIELYFDKKIAENNSKNDYDKYIQIEKNGGRIETRICLKLKDIEYIKENFNKWKGLKSIFCIERKIEEKEKISCERSYYISSLEETPEKLLRYTRNHWKIESYHWILDVNYKEDFCKVKNENVQRNLNSFRKISIKLHKDYIERNKPKRKTIISSIRNCLLSNKKLEEFLDDIK